MFIEVSYVVGLLLISVYFTATVLWLLCLLLLLSLSLSFSFSLFRYFSLSYRAVMACVVLFALNAGAWITFITADTYIYIYMYIVIIH